MSARDIVWDSVAANSSTSWFIHGFGNNEAVTFSIAVFPGLGVSNPVGHATLTQGESFQHVDGTKAYKFSIQNNAPFNSCDFHVMAIVESL